MVDHPFSLPFKIFREIQRENIRLEFPLPLPLAYAFYDLQKGQRYPNIFLG